MNFPCDCKNVASRRYIHKLRASKWNLLTDEMKSRCSTCAVLSERRFFSGLGWVLHSYVVWVIYFKTLWFLSFFHFLFLLSIRQESPFTNCGDGSFYYHCQQNPHLDLQCEILQYIYTGQFDKVDKDHKNVLFSNIRFALNPKKLFGFIDFRERLSGLTSFIYRM